MKEQILKLRDDGKSYKEIKEIIGYSMGTISYYCGKNQKEKANTRTRKARSENRLTGRINNFKNRKLYFSTIDFQREISTKNGKREVKFSQKDVLEKFGEDTKCYLSGVDINLITDINYQLDHIIPIAKGGNNTLDNLGICHKTVNQMKRDLLNDELIEWCKKILIHHGYKVEDRVNDTL